MKVRYVLILVLGLCLVAYALTGVTLVRPGERAVVRRFGRVLPDKPEPGLFIGLPWGMDQVDRIPVDRVQSVAVGYQEEGGSSTDMPAGQLLTGDHNLVNVRVTLHYKVRANEVEKFLIHADRIDTVLSRVGETALADWVAARNVDDVLLNAKTQLGPAVLERMRRQMADPNNKDKDIYDLGVELLDVRVALVTPPDEVKPAFDKVAAAQTAIRTLTNNAKQQAASNERLAESYQYMKDQETTGYVHQQLELARGDAESFEKRLAAYQAGRAKNPDYLRQIWEEERGKLLAKLKESGQIGLLDHHLGPDGLDITVAPPLPKKP